MGQTHWGQCDLWTKLLFFFFWLELKFCGRSRCENFSCCVITYSWSLEVIEIMCWVHKLTTQKYPFIPISLWRWMIGCLLGTHRRIGHKVRIQVILQVECIIWITLTGLCYLVLKMAQLPELSIRHFKSLSEKKSFLMFAL